MLPVRGTVFPCIETRFLMKLPKPVSKKKGIINAIIETPGNSRSKFTFDPKRELFKFGKSLPAGMEFPCAMGFIPGTRGGDGDPLDILVFMDGPSFPGCWVECRVIGVIRAKQRERSLKEQRNDRFIAVPAGAKDYAHIKKVEDLGRNNIDAVVAFFENYNKLAGKRFRKLSIEDFADAIRTIKRQKTGTGR
jgi:inorganic pyrophosphatase